MVAAREQSLERRAELQYQGEQPGDVRQTHTDISKAQPLRGYEPTTSLASGIR